MTLKDLRPGESGTVIGFANQALPRRLLEMGLLPGTEVTVVRLAPFGDPMDLKVHGYHLSIRKKQASLICVDKIRS